MWRSVISDVRRMTMPAYLHSSGIRQGSKARHGLLGFAADEACREVWVDAFEEIVGR